VSRMPTTSITTPSVVSDIHLFSFIPGDSHLNQLLVANQVTPKSGRKSFRHIAFNYSSS
jgi:hypothetical protein